MYETTRHAAVEQRPVKESLSWECKSREHVWKQRTVRLQWIYLFITILGLWVSNNSNLTTSWLKQKEGIDDKRYRRLRIWEQKCSWVSTGSQNWEQSELEPAGTVGALGCLCFSQPLSFPGRNRFLSCLLHVVDTRWLPTTPRITHHTFSSMKKEVDSGHPFSLTY